MRPPVGLQQPPPLRSGHPPGCSRLPHFVGEAKTRGRGRHFFVSPTVKVGRGRERGASSSPPPSRWGRRGRADARPQRGQPTIASLERVPRTRYRLRPWPVESQERCGSPARCVRSQPSPKTASGITSGGGRWGCVSDGKSPSGRSSPISRASRLASSLKSTATATPIRLETGDEIGGSWTMAGSSSGSGTTYVLDQTDDAIDLIDLALHNRDAVPDPLNLES